MGVMEGNENIGVIEDVLLKNIFDEINNYVATFIPKGEDDDLWLAFDNVTDNLGIVVNDVTEKPLNAWTPRWRNSSESILASSNKMTGVTTCVSFSAFPASSASGRRYPRQGRLHGEGPAPGAGRRIRLCGQGRSWLVKIGVTTNPNARLAAFGPPRASPISSEYPSHLSRTSTRASHSGFTSGITSSPQIKPPGGAGW